MAITFDGAARTIYLSTGTVTLDVRDLYSRWKEWVLLSDNSKWPIAFTSVGGNPIDATAGTSIPAYIYLENGWHIHPQSANHTLNVFGGVLLRQGGGDPFEDIPGYTIRINYSQPVQAIQVGSSYTTQDAAKLDELHKLQGLDASNPLSVSATTRIAGAITQSISENAGTTTVARQ